MLRVILLVFVLVGCQAQSQPQQSGPVYNENGLTKEEQKIFDEFVKPRRDRLIAI